MILMLIEAKIFRLRKNIKIQEWVKAPFQKFMDYLNKWDIPNPCMDRLSECTQHGSLHLLKDGAWGTIPFTASFRGTADYLLLAIKVSESSGMFPCLPQVNLFSKAG